MYEPMSFELFLKTHRTPAISVDERLMLEDSVERSMTFRSRQVIVRENVPLTQCTLVTEGFVYRFKDTKDGRRQILAIHLPGDFVDLHSYPLKRLEHSVMAITAVKVALVPHARVHALIERSATLAELLWRSTMIDAAVNREWMVSLGARSAAVRIAHLFCELYLRMQRAGLTNGNRFALPLTQVDLGDATGLTAVHTNRMLRRLRQAGLATFANGEVTILDWDGLKTFADFDASYLFFD
jgi:CRP-like cAMP-binding protein